MSWNIKVVVFPKKLIDGTISPFFCTLLRRQSPNGSWQYRNLTLDEKIELFDDTQW